MLEEANRCPGRRDGSRSKGGEAQSLRYDFLNGSEWEIVQVAEPGDDGHGGSKDQEETRHSWERVEPEGKVGSQTRWICGVKSCAGERRNERMSL